jgi:hypothetical protein
LTPILEILSIAGAEATDALAGVEVAVGVGVKVAAGVGV